MAGTGYRWYHSVGVCTGAGNCLNGWRVKDHPRQYRRDKNENEKCPDRSNPANALTRKAYIVKLGYKGYEEGMELEAEKEKQTWKRGIPEVEGRRSVMRHGNALRESDTQGGHFTAIRFQNAARQSHVMRRKCASGAPIIRAMQIKSRANGVCGRRCRYHHRTAGGGSK